MIILHDFMQHSNLKSRFLVHKIQSSFLQARSARMQKSGVSTAHAQVPHGGTCGLSPPIGLALPLPSSTRRRSRSHFYSLQTARRGEQKFLNHYRREREREREETRALTNAPLRELITKKAILIRRSNSVPRPFVEAVQRP